VAWPADVEVTTARASAALRHDAPPPRTAWLSGWRARAYDRPLATPRLWACPHSPAVHRRASPSPARRPARSSSLSRRRLTPGWDQRAASLLACIRLRQRDRAACCPPCGRAVYAYAPQRGRERRLARLSAERRGSQDLPPHSCAPCRGGCLGPSIAGVRRPERLPALDVAVRAAARDAFAPRVWAARAVVPTLSAPSVELPFSQSRPGASGWGRPVLAHEARGLLLA
jgi:hypothetical protein